MFKNILIPTDGSERATTAVKHGVDFAKEIGAKVTGLTVTEPFHVWSLKPSQLEHARRIQEAFENPCREGAWRRFGRSRLG